MDNATIKTFAINSRRKLMEDVVYRMSLIGVSKDGIQDSITDAEGIQTFNIGGSIFSIYDEDIKKRENLIKEVENKGFENVVEEVAYTWFNRIIAIRYMEVNDYLPTRTRVLSSETPGKIEPDIITQAFNLDLNYTEEDKKYVFKMKDESKLDELFRFLFIKQCNKLNEILPGLFEKTEDFMELLLNISFVSGEGIVRNLVDTIPEKDFTNQVEIIGWLYQYYNTELKDDTFKTIKKNKVPKERIPAATQLFTPDWIVKYLVENSVGRLWLEGHPNNELKDNWTYYLEEPIQENEVELKLAEIRSKYEDFNPEDITVIDPCMGSGHILVYVFDVLMQIYVSMGYSERDAAISILENNLYGLDIDDRAYQLSYFAVMMKARSYNRSILNKNISPKLLSIKESNNLSDDLIKVLVDGNSDMANDLNYIIEIFRDAKEYGSALNIFPKNFNHLLIELNNLNKSSNLYFETYKNDLILLRHLILQAKLLSSKYDVVITNPPYMGPKGMNNKLMKFLKKEYPLTKRDLFAVFMEKCFNFTNDYGFTSIVTMQSWMFLSSYEKIRNFLFENYTIYSLLDIGKGIFDMGFDTSATIFREIKVPDYKGNYNQVLFEDIVENVPFEFPLLKNKNNVISLDEFSSIPGNAMAYWASQDIINAFKNGSLLTNFGDTKQGMATSDNNRFLRLWYEVDYDKIGFNYLNIDDTKDGKHKWFPYNKGGPFRKWYGNYEYVVNWENNGIELKEYASELYKSATRTIKNISFYFKPCISWGIIGGNNISVRYYPNGFIFDVAGCCCFYEKGYKNYLLGFLNSKISNLLVNILNPTFNIQVGDVAKLPLIYSNEYADEIETIVDRNISLVSDDWNFSETSWDFKKHPFLNINDMITSNSLNDIYDKWINLLENMFNELKGNEKRLNDIFIEIYDLNDLDSNLTDKDISIRIPNLSDDIKSFISYAIGCMFGRYSLDQEGLVFAGGKFKIDNYSSFIPDYDNIIPILDTEYFYDDIVGRFVEFIKTCFGEETLEENLDFIASGLKKKGNTSREIIRNYFLNYFFKDHIQTYKKCPIYWMFSSGKENGFNCLVYMHRYDSNIVARIRTEYLHKTQRKIEENMGLCDNIINNSNVASEKSKATKEKNKLIKQLEETREYDEALAYIANQNIKIDLDDGVKVNYAKFQNVEVNKEGQKTKKINLLKKI